MTAQHQPGPRVLVFGSCVSRDILNFAQTGAIALADYYARSSLASLGTEPSQLDETCLGRITSPFQRRMVERDLNKSFFQNISERRDFDFILIDLIDERFDQFEMGPDSVATISSEFLLTRFVTSQHRSSEQWIPSGSKRHRDLWLKGIEKLFAVLAENGLADRVIVNKVFWADQMEDCSPLPGRDEARHRAANAHLAWMYEVLEKYVPAPRWLTFSDDALKTNPTHRWGPAPFHYTDGYYAAAVEQLRELYSKRAKDGGVVVGNRKLVAWSAFTSHECQRTCFLVFRDKILIDKRPYSSSNEMQFDTQKTAGDYEVVILTLTSGKASPFPNTNLRTETLHRFHIGDELCA